MFVLEIDKVKKEVDEVKINVNEMKTEVKDQLGMMRNQMQFNQEEMMKAVRNMKAAMNEFVDESTKQFNQIKDEMKDVKQSMGRFPNANIERNIVVAGGHDGKSELNSVETFSWVTETWKLSKPMKQRLNNGASFVYQQQMIVTGGISDVAMSDSMERLNMDEEPGQWLRYVAKLPAKLMGHTNVVYQNRLIVTGGYTDKPDNGVSDCIYEVQLAATTSTNVLRREMPQPRVSHCSQLFEDKIFTFGGTKTIEDKESYDNVLVYNITTNKCEEKVPLLFAVNRMASVSWNNDVILMGGVDKDGNVLNTVVKYDVKTGKNEWLPPMKYKRCASVAVVTGNGVVVMGGWNKEQGCLDSVEYFSFNHYVWKELPPMIEKRAYPFAEVIPVA